jgi:xanthine dehydrogenase accessory factor
MLDRYIDTIQKLLKKKEIFCTAVVIQRDAPSSSKIGDKAIINQKGEVIGWVGGGCVKGILLKEAEDAMKTGKSRIVKVGNTMQEEKKEGTHIYPMTCQSDGAVTIYIEPIIPPIHIVVIGKSDIAKSLVKVANVMGYKITGVAEDADMSTYEKVDELITHIDLQQVATTKASFIIIATQGDGDEKALEEALKKESALVGMVASKKKIDKLKAYLHGCQKDPQKIETIKAPIGLDIMAKKPNEVAISIIAEIVQYANSTSLSSFKGYDNDHITKGAQKTAYYINPVCGVPVDVNNPKHIVEYNGEQVYFCCDGCKIKFELEPAKYIKG